MTRVKNVRDTIYLLIYTRPRYAFEISNILYERENKAIFTELKKLVTDGWIEEYKDEIQQGYDDGRSSYRKYYKTSLDPIIKRINETYLIPPTDQKATDYNTMFRELFNSYSFKYWIEKKLPDDFKTTSIDALDFILTFLDILYIIKNNNKFLKQRCEKITDVESYYHAIDVLRKDKKFQDNVLKLADLLYDEKEFSGDLVYMFALPEVSDIRPYGFSSFGSIYDMAHSLSQSVFKLLSD